MDGCKNNVLSEIESAPILLSKQVEQAVELYLTQLNGYDTSNFYHAVICEVEKPLLTTVLKHVAYNQTKAAKMLGLSRSTLRKKMDSYQLI
jgi:Fis family transcriptional regulator